MLASISVICPVFFVCLRIQIMRLYATWYAEIDFYICWQQYPIKKISVIRRLAFGGKLRADLGMKRRPNNRILHKIRRSADQVGSTSNRKNHQLLRTEFPTKTAYFSVNANLTLNLLMNVY